MKIFLPKMNAPSQKMGHVNRSGISIIEVLTAIVVAMIGVFGVLILIPFAVRQAQTGLESDMANTMARNSFDLYEITGYRYLVDEQPRWADETGTQISVVGPYAVDPLGALQNRNLTAIDYPLAPGSGYPVFPDAFVGASITTMADITAYNNLLTPTVNLLDQGDLTVSPVVEPAPFNLALARQMCQSSDDLTFREAEAGEFVGRDSGLIPPLQIFDVDSTGGISRRQSYGRMSWMMLAVPMKDDLSLVNPTEGTGGWRYRMHTLVFQDRAYDANITNPLVRFPNAELVDTEPMRPQPLPNTAYGGGNVRCNLENVRRDDWVMMGNFDPDAEIGFEKQIGFYRVIGVYNDAGAGNSVLTLDGPDFDFDIVDSATGNRVPTFIVHLVQNRFNAAGDSQGRDGRVVNVFERTLRWEQESSWN